MSTSTGYCNCCGKPVVLLTDVELNESVCSVCRSYDVVRDSIRNSSPRLTLHDIADAFMDAFEVRP
jgi:negative regulator of sigma E activity